MDGIGDGDEQTLQAILGEFPSFPPFFSSLFAFLAKASAINALSVFISLARARITSKCAFAQSRYIGATATATVTAMALSRRGAAHLSFSSVSRNGTRSF